MQHRSYYNMSNCPDQWLFQQDSIHTGKPPGDVIFSAFWFDPFQQRLGEAGEASKTFPRESPCCAVSKKDIWRIGHNRWIYQFWILPIFGHLLATNFVDSESNQMCLKIKSMILRALGGPFPQLEIWPDSRRGDGDPSNFPIRSQGFPATQPRCAK